MKKIVFILLIPLLLLAGRISAEADSYHIHASATYEAPDGVLCRAPVRDGAASAALAEGVTLTVTGIPNGVAQVLAFCIPATEAESLAWLGACVHAYGVPVHAYVILFADADGNRSNATDAVVSVSCAHCTSAPNVVGVRADGGTVALRTVDGRFTADGSDYYVAIADPSASDPSASETEEGESVTRDPLASETETEDSLPRMGDAGWALLLLGPLAVIVLAGVCRIKGLARAKPCAILTIILCAILFILWVGSRKPSDAPAAPDTDPTSGTGTTLAPTPDDEESPSEADTEPSEPPESEERLPDEESDAETAAETAAQTTVSEPSETTSPDEPENGTSAETSADESTVEEGTTAAPDEEERNESEETTSAEETTVVEETTVTNPTTSAPTAPETEPGATEPGATEPGATESEVVTTPTEETETEEAETEDSESDTPDMNVPDMNVPDMNVPDMNVPETDASEDEDTTTETTAPPAPPSEEPPSEEPPSEGLPSETEPSETEPPETEPPACPHPPESCVTLPGYPPDSGYPGMTDGKQCTQCGEILQEQVTIPSL